MAVLAKPRFTADIDIVIELLPQKIPQLSRELLLIDKDVYVNEESIKGALKNKGEFNFIHPQTGLKVDFWMWRYSFERFEKAVVKKVDGQKVNFISPEDLILSKLIWYKEGQGAKQLEDIRSLLKIAKPDLTYIKKWAEQQSTIEILNKILNAFEN
ncbi:MAG: hypothetical protein COT59_01735 [Candidatus Nealsonbacteria bacterium CG09_land_8_20_14_0_10_42_14]|uniref:Uncharacterized protein n=1 Tax=Candidatus Nealsonbacteria bacterium CG09_land_8_20_14_0_10_42_14 TaxID=1974707 RepID=A0A2H0WX23_9BACT|nr:MAG: hypothetical protein COT59_01735 [Candidatus Nealsonbacteria bacterium CG09_land_8_20_14_0_10_42_14]